MLSKIVSGAVLAVVLSAVAVPVVANAATCKATMSKSKCEKAKGTYDADKKTCTCPSK
jgi:hypothetical protein